ncbi:MAG: substrate-binding domain-containing protein [Ilumatobacteraceae bacterium]
MKFRRSLIAVTAFAVASTAGAVAPANAASINGGGASFMANMMDICAAQYNRNTQYNPDKHVVTYASVGSSSGQSGFKNGTYTFGGSESAYSSGAPADLVYVPLVGGPIAIGYRLDALKPAGATMRLNGEVIAKIFAGQITKWNDPAIVALNKGATTKKKLRVSKGGVTVTAKKVASNVQFTVSMTAAAAKKYRNAKVTITAATVGGATKSILNSKYRKRITKNAAYVRNTTYTIKAGRTNLGVLAVAPVTNGVKLTLPDQTIRVVHRSDGSGTTNNFANYLNKSYPSIWTKATNNSFTTAFPGTVPTDGSFQSARGNEGVSSYVRDNDGSITYAEPSFLDERSVKYADVLNPGGQYVKPTPVSSASWFEGAEVTAEGLVSQSFTYKAADAYPINAISYGLTSSASSTNNALTKGFFSYFLNQCSPKAAPGAGYTPLTGKILEKALVQLAKVNGGA